MSEAKKRSRKKEKFYYYEFNLVLYKQLTDKEQNKIWDKIIDVIRKTLATGGSRPLTESKWKKMMRVLNE